MEEFLNRLYSYEYFGTYLMISIAVLILLFIIILFFGKKDQKKREIEETKKLQQINSEENAFKEENNQVDVKVEEKEIKTLENKNLEDTIIVPNIENIDVNESIVKEMPETIPNINNDNEQVKVETLEDISKNEEIITPLPNITDSNNLIKEDNFISLGESLTSKEPEVNQPILDKIEEKPIVFNNDFDVLDVNETPEVPEFNFDEIIKEIEDTKEPIKQDISKAPEVFSSVFVEEKKPEVEKVVEPQIESKDEDDLDMELPTLKKTVKEEVKNEEIELPSLNDLSGETYNIH